MGKKTKTGKNRLDKYYQMAKDQGYRSRAAFKLIQLNKRFNFLANARAVVDLCAAPGSWLQVASKFMPASKVLIGVDLDKIQPIPNTITLEQDITTVQCFNEINKHLSGATVDVVLHDGAPNVGGNWSKDAFSQSELTLSALKLATTLLMKGGTFVTKVFRSADYNSLLWAFNCLFKKVTPTKPQASRAASAEIFVVCEGYLKPDTLDPRILDPKYVFKEIKTSSAPINVLKQKSLNRVNRQGYDDDSMLLFKRLDVLDFIYSEDPVSLLGTYNEITFTPNKNEVLSSVKRERDDDDDAEERKIFFDHPATDDELKEFFKDLRVIHSSDFKKIIKWRLKMYKFVTSFDKDDTVKPEEIVLTEEQKRNLKEQEMQDIINQLAKLKRRKLNLQRKRKIKYSMKMGYHINEKDENDLIDDSSTIFTLGAVKTDTILEQLVGSRAKQFTEKLLDKVDDDEINFGDDNSSDNEDDWKTKREGAKRMDEDFETLQALKAAEPAKKKKRTLYEEDMDEEGNPKKDRKTEQYLDILYDSMLQRREKQKKFMLDASKRASHLNPVVPLDVVLPSAERDEDDDEEENADNKLVLNKKKISPAEVDMWFDNDIFEGIDDEDEERDVISKKMKQILKKNETAKRAREEAIKNEFNDDEYDNSDDDDVDIQPRKRAKPTYATLTEESFFGAEDGEENLEAEEIIKNFENDLPKLEYVERIKKPRTNQPKQQGAEENNEFDVVPLGPDPYDFDVEEQAEMLALGKNLLDPKTRALTIESQYNKFAYDDNGVNLPHWFIEDEAKHSTPLMPTTKDEVIAQKIELKAINSQSTKKVAEAQARKKKKMDAKVAKTKMRAKNISASDIPEAQKIREIQKLYKGSLRNKVKRNKVYVAGGKVVGKEKGGNVKMRVVDKRMKTDKRHKKAQTKRIDKKKGGGGTKIQSKNKKRKSAAKSQAD